MNQLPDRPCLSAKFNLSCGMDCKFTWDGFGRWLGKNWKPYLTGMFRDYGLRQLSRTSVTPVRKFIINQQISVVVQMVDVSKN